MAAIELQIQPRVTVKAGNFPLQAHIPMLGQAGTESVYGELISQQGEGSPCPFKGEAQIRALLQFQAAIGFHRPGLRACAAEAHIEGGSARQVA